MYEPHRRILQEQQQMQEVQLYYRRYRRYSCTTTNAAVPNFGTGTFKCISPIDVSSGMAADAGGRTVLQEVQDIQLYTANAANAAVPNFGTGTTIFKFLNPIYVSRRNGSRFRRLKTVLHEVQEMQLYYRRCRRHSCSWIWYKNSSIHVYEPHRRIMQE